MENKFIACDFQRILFSIYNNRGHHPIIPNFSGISKWEADLFSISKAGFMYEFEIKLSRGDFQKEFKNKKGKHKMLETGNKCVSEQKEGIRIHSPNYFYFVCPEDMVSADEIPDYAGLIHINFTPKYAYRGTDICQIRRLKKNFEMVEIKKPKRIHIHKANTQVYKKIAQTYSSRMMYGNKFYDYSIDNGYFG